MKINGFKLSVENNINAVSFIKLIIPDLKVYIGNSVL